MRMLTLFGSAAPPSRGRRPKVGSPDMQHRKILDISAAETAPLEPDHKMIHKPLIYHQPSTFRTLHGSTLLGPLTTPCEPRFRLSGLLSIRKKQAQCQSSSQK